MVRQDILTDSQVTQQTGILIWFYLTFIMKSYCVVVIILQRSSLTLCEYNDFQVGLFVCGLSCATQTLQSILAKFCRQKKKRKTNLDPFQYLHGEIFYPHLKFQIEWIPIKITGFCLWKFYEQQWWFTCDKFIYKVFIYEVLKQWTNAMVTSSDILWFVNIYSI